MKTVKQLSKEFAGICDDVYVSFALYSPPLPRAVTIASVDPIDLDELSVCMWHAVSSIVHGDIPAGESVDAFVTQQLAERGFIGVAVCSRDDEFDRTRDQIIALERLLGSHNKEETRNDNSQTAS